MINPIAPIKERNASFHAPQHDHEEDDFGRWLNRGGRGWRESRINDNNLPGNPFHRPRLSIEDLTVLMKDEQQEHGQHPSLAHNAYTEHALSLPSENEDYHQEDPDQYVFEFMIFRKPLH